MSVLEGFGTAKSAGRELEELFGGTRVFDYPKPVNLLKNLIQISTDPKDIVLDSFAGSGTTAHAVLDLNKEDEGHRKFILVEMEGYANKTTAERVRRASKKYGYDAGFTYYALGPAIDAETLLEGKKLPTFKEFAKYVYYLATGKNPPRLGNEHPNIVPYQVFATEDGHIVLSIGNDPTFARFCNAFGLEHLLADERFATNAARVANRAFVTDTLAAVLARHPSAWWLERLEELKIGCGPINTLEQVFADPHVIARGNLIEMTRSDGVPVKLVANPVRLSETPVDYRLAPPMLGEHTDEVLTNMLGLDEPARAALRRDGII